MTIFGRAVRLVRAPRRRRVPMRYQMSVVECGAACLAMILSYHGRRTGVPECREQCSVGRDGLTAGGLVKAAASFGLRVTVRSVEPYELAAANLPAIAHWDFNHFVVLEKWSPRSVHIVDPGAGRRRLTAEEFDAGFTGVILEATPGPDFERVSPRRQSPWIGYLKTMLKARGFVSGLIQILAASVLLQVVSLIFPLVTKIVVDDVLPLHMTNMMAVLGAGLLTFVAAQSLGGFMRNALMIKLRSRLDSRLMSLFFEHLLSLPFKFFHQRASGDLLMRLSSNSMIRELLTNQTVSVILDGSFVLGYLAILLGAMPRFGVVVCGLGFLQAGVLLLSRGRIKRLAQRELATRSEEQSYLVEVMKGIAVLKSSGAEQRAFDRWWNLFVKQMNASVSRSFFSAVLEAVITALRTGCPLLLLWIGALYVLEGRLSLGTMLAVNALAASFLTPLATMVSSAQQVQMMGASLERVADVLQTEPEQLEREKLNTSRVNGSIEVKNVSFRYDSNSPLVLRDISLTVKPGQKIALVGQTGSGKTTLAMLLLGLYRSTSGEIRFDGAPIETFDYRSLRNQIGVVLQEPVLFSGSVLQNITLVNPDLRLDDVARAAKLAAIHDEILAMPMQYETLISEGGASLSGGQRQRIALARALADKPSILLLDEATSHLDVVTEDLVDRNLAALSCTRIVVAHRLSTIRNADQILVLDHGCVIERGSHLELLEQSGFYAKLVERQVERDHRRAPASSPLPDLHVHAAARPLPPGSPNFIAREGQNP
ncbi:MAG TPA: peptidase domain-containing ABC transporter [Blastocatellia bacterium]|nr:peptidase domain-containing ABC transporter [Blastocatellia bacterium]